MNYSALIKELRERRFLSQTDLAKILGVTYVTISRWESGRFKPTFSSKRKLNNLFIEERIIKVKQ